VRSKPERNDLAAVQKRLIATVDAIMAATDSVLVQ
jgi:hypothetical protein